LHGASWTDPSNTWYQSFVATSPRVPAISTILAGAGPNEESLRIAIAMDSGAASVTEWPVIAEREVPLSVKAGADLWARFARDEVELVPGSRYAIRLQADDSFQPYKRDKDADSYALGQAYRGSGEPEPFDLNISVFAEPDGACITHQRQEPGFGSEVGDGGLTSFGQTFVATGTSLAAFDLWAKGLGASSWDVAFTFSVRKGGPDGPLIGSPKHVQAGYQAASVGLHGVSYSPDEIALVPGETYTIHIEADEPVIPFAESQDVIPGGDAYVADAALGQDLSVTLVEYGCDAVGEDPEDRTEPSGPDDDTAAMGEPEPGTAPPIAGTGLIGGCAVSDHSSSQVVWWLFAALLVLARRSRPVTNCSRRGLRT